MAEMNQQNNNHQRFLGKRVKIILTFPNGSTITYRGELLGADERSIIIKDIKLGEILIAHKDISQIIQVEN